MTIPYELIPIRLSHLLGHSGVGAIVRGPKDLVVVHDIRQWTDRNGEPGGRRVTYVERIRAAMDVKQELREPPVAREAAHGGVDGVCVPVSRFPRWTHCPSPTCGWLDRRPWLDTVDDPPRCKRCKHRPVLEQVTWAVIDPAGYLDEVPWFFLAHKSASAPEQVNCKVFDNLRLVEDGVSRRLRCEACKSEVKFRGDEKVQFGTGRMQPWTRDDLVPARDPKDSSQPLAQVLAINDARIYEAVTKIALAIPPESRVRKGTAVDRLYRNSEDRRKIDSARTPLAKKGAIRDIATRYRSTPADIEEALKDIGAGYPLYGAVFTPGQLRESEYQAFLDTLPDQQPDEDLVTQDRTSGWQALVEEKGSSEDIRSLVTGIRHLVRVDRLKAVKVFKGFRRPVQANEPPVVPPDIVGNSDWLPAVELHGEGIFLTLDEDRLARWEQHPAVVSRLEPLISRFTRSGHDAPNPLTSRFMLLHTLSHLLMRGIEAEGGYPAASLSEIIYCAGEPELMAGVLIYVAVPDIAGSLGGIAELAEPRRFLGILTRSIEHAYWCSLDPVCSEHEGQGPGLLNRAACHACTLVPDTACEFGNTLLDRGFVKGDGAGLPGFFGA
jgi:Domain of unknown function (DUF1998)